MPKRKPHKRRKDAPRRCIFCSNLRVTGEHLWSEWLHPYLPKLEDPKKHEVYRVIRNFKVVEYRDKKPQVGHTYTKRVFVACKQCNSGWMGAIEEAAKPILIPLLQGVPVTLTAEHRMALAKWIALKVMVAEHENPRDAVIRQPARTDFMNSGAIPSEIRIWIGYHDDPGWYTGYWHRTALVTLGLASSLPPPPVLRNVKNIQTTAFGIGHLFTFSWVTTIDELELGLGSLEEAGVVKRLWPLIESNIAWPLPMLPSADVDLVAESLVALLRSPLAVWRSLPPE
jgi:hypothetical protein